MPKKKPPVKRAKKKLRRNKVTLRDVAKAAHKAGIGVKVKLSRKKPRKNQSMDQPHFGHAGEQALIPDRNEAESITMTDITNVKKLTTKIIVGKKIGKIEVRQQLYSIIGVATGLKTGESNYGAWTALVGRFEAERTQEGALFSAPLVLLPDEAAAPIISAVKIHEGVEFALVVTVEPTLSAPGYVYDIATVITPRKNDMLAGLRSALRAYHDATDPL
jgi:hypothetical protein